MTFNHKAIKLKSKNINFFETHKYVGIKYCSPEWGYGVLIHTCV